MGTGLVALALAAGLAFPGEARFRGTWEPVAAVPEGLVAVLDTGWAVRPPSGFAPIEASGRLQWRKDVLLPRKPGGRDGGTQYEYITASRESLPSGLVPFCAERAEGRGLPGPSEKAVRGRRVIRYLCPGSEWSPTHGDSHSWRCLLEVDSRTGVELNFWSTWHEVQDPSRVQRDHAAGLKAFEDMCGSLEPIGAPAARPVESVGGALGVCQNQPDGYFARVQSVEKRGRSFSVFRAGSGTTRWSLVQASTGARVSLALGGHSSESALEELRPSDWVRVRQDCTSGLAEVVDIQRTADGAAGGPKVRLSRLNPKDRQAIEREMAAKRETDPWNACFRLRLFQRCVLVSR